MRWSLLGFMFFWLSGCGHLAPYSEHRGDQVELYTVNGSQYLRVPYKVMVYDLIPHSYLDEEWIALGNSELGPQLLVCQPGRHSRYGAPTPMLGTVELQTSEAIIQLAFPSTAEAAANGKNGTPQPFKFNGHWHLATINALPAPGPKHRKFGCE